jgi:hypothetical protein
MLIYILLISFIVFGIFTLLHLRPLTEEEVISLASKRRGKSVAKYYLFRFGETLVNSAFKKNMAASGRFHEVEMPLYGCPSTVAGLLKYKKHEWIIIAFEEGSRIKKIWLNKGYDNSSASSYLSLEEIVRVAKKYGATSILFFHNHPNPNPRRYSCINPSPTDMETAERYGEFLQSKGFNLLKFVCERGKFYEYYRIIADIFMPQVEFVRAIQEMNDISKWRNYNLHFERLFK